MKGLAVFDYLSQEVKNKIVTEYGSLKELYARIISLEQQFYISKNNMVKNAIYDIEDKLQELGVPDGTNITIPIEEDFNEIAVGGEIEKLNQHLRSNGLM